MTATLWICVLLIGPVISKNDMKGIEFLNNNNEIVNIRPDISSLYTNGFTVCLRIMFSYIGLSNIFDAPDSAGLEIEPYWLETGVIQIFDINYHFLWPSNGFSLEPYVWYSFCVIYSVTDNLVCLALNGNISYSEAGRSTRRNFQLLFENIYLGQCFQALETIHSVQDIFENTFSSIF